MAPIKCFFLTPTNRVRRFARCYSNSTAPSNQCVATKSYHNASIYVDTVVVAEQNLITPGFDTLAPTSGFEWPQKCEACDYLFTEQDERMMFPDRIWVDGDGNEHSIHPKYVKPGAMFYTDWFQQDRLGPDGRHLVVACPDRHLWSPDNRASNCTLPHDKEHRCWVRHGVPPNITVDKNGYTCQAGAGSIVTPDNGWHGFLRDGYLVT